MGSLCYAFSMNDEEQEHQWDGPSRSQLRREAIDVFKLAESLALLSDAQLLHVPLDDAILEEVRRARAISAQIARKRQTQFLAKKMRQLEADELAAIRAALEHDRADSRRDTADLHRLEAWRARMLTEGDSALGEFIAQHPGADRQRLRQLVRQATLESEANKPPRAFRELFRELRDAAAGAGEFP